MYRRPVMLPIYMELAFAEYRLFRIFIYRFYDYIAMLKC